MTTKLKIDDLNQSEVLDREAMCQVSGGGRTGQGINPGAQLKRRFRDAGGKGWATRYHARSR